MFVAIKRILIQPVITLRKWGRVDSLTLSRYWATLSIGTLLLAGFFSAIIVIGRTPVISEFIADPNWAKRALVVHVDFALLIWLYAFLASMFVLIPNRRVDSQSNSIGFGLALVGMALLISSIFMSSAQPVLSNYIPVLDHPIFIGGLVIFAAGICCCLYNQRLFGGGNPTTGPLLSSAIPGLRSAAILLAVALVTFFISWFATPVHLSPDIYYEFTIWGGGHLLQFVNIAAMLSIWIILSGKLLGRNPISYRASLILFGLFTAPVLAAPFLTINGTTDGLYRVGFTQYMRWGIFPIVTVFLGVLLYKIIQGKKQGLLPKQLWKNMYFGGLMTSMLLTVMGFVLGAFIRGSNTLVPAHYHASVGGITVAFMAMTYVLFEIQKMPLPKGRIRKWASVQPLLFGLGQAIFAAGFGYAGLYGLARKTFGAEQIISSPEILIGLLGMSIGGLLAMIGGLLYLWIVFKTWNSHRKLA